MKILVPIKRVVDHNINVKVSAGSNSVATDGLKMVINPFCEIALEEAIKLKEQGIASSVIALSIGNNATQEQLRNAIAMGADRAIHLTTDESLSPLSIAKIIQKTVEAESPKLILLGKQAIDADNNQTGQMLAALCDYPQGTFISELTIHDDKQSITIDRETDEGLQTIALQLPAVITVDLRLNMPRFISLPNIMKARRVAIETKEVSSLGLNLTSSVTTLKVEEPKIDKSCQMLSSIEELLSALSQEIKGA